MIKQNAWWLAASAAIFLFVWQQIQSVRVGYGLDEVRRSIRTQKARNAELQMELDALSSPQRLAQLARLRLNMRPAEPGDLVLLDEAPSALKRNGPILISRLFQ